MTRVKNLFAGMLMTAIAAVPAANAQTAAVAGVGSSAQFLGTMIGGSQLLANNLSGQCQYHWTKKSALEAHDNRDALNRILDENGNMGLVWLADCSDGTGNTNISKVILIGQYDSTLGMRLFLAQQKPAAGEANSGATLYLNGTTAGTASDNLVEPNNLWADNKADTPIPANMVAFIGNAAPGTIHVNLGLTDIRPEDALYATTRTKAALNTTTYAGLGYVGPTGQIGAPIYTAQSGSSSNFTPIGFALSGNDPISAEAVRSYTTVPVGAAPIVFAYNNGGTFSSSVANLVSGVKGDGTADAGKYAAANLFDGTTSCDTDSKAFGGSGDGAGTAVTLFLREPLSGTMNTTEFNVFRTTGNTSDSQEKGVTNPTRAPYNPLNLACNGKGSRQRRIGTGQVLSAINGTAGGLGYFFYSFANATSVNGGATNNQANYNYLTLDGVDPLGLSPSAPNGGGANQELPYCNATLCPASTWWTGGISYPNLRNGTYKAWSLYRWAIDSNNDDPTYGPTALAASMQNNIDSTVADFVPFVTAGNTDGLEVYRSHFTQSTKAGNNGPASPTESLTNGNSLGGGTEAGGDEGGVIYGHDWAAVNTVNQATGACAGKTKVTKVANLFVNGQNSRNFGFSGETAAHPTGQPLLLEGTTATINGNPYTVSSCAAPTATVLYVTPQLGTTTHSSMETYIAPAAPGELNKKQ